MESNSTSNPPTSRSYARVPLGWIKAAGNTGFKDMRLAAYLWFEHGVNRGRQFQASPHKARKLTGISQKQFQKGIRRLLDAIFIHATHRPGSRTLVRMEATSLNTPNPHAVQAIG